MHNTVGKAALGALALVALRPGTEIPLITTALAGAGWRVTTVDGPDALMAAAQAEIPGLLLLDADLAPFANGEHAGTAFRRLCQQRHLADPGRQQGESHTRLVLLSSQRDARVEALASALAATRVLLLPSGKTGSAVPSAETPCDELLSECTIWVVDDNQAIRMLARAAFERAGWRVHEFEDLQAAHAALNSLPTPQAVLLDIHLPDGNGLEHVRGFAASGAAVVMVSNLAGPDQVELAFAAGAQDVVPKPFDLRSLVARVERAVAASGKQPLTAAPVPHVAQSDVEHALIRNTEWM